MLLVMNSCFFRCLLVAYSYFDLMISYLLSFNFSFFYLFARHLTLAYAFDTCIYVVYFYELFCYSYSKGRR